MARNIMLTREELELIGVTRFKQPRYRKNIIITGACLLLTLVVTVALMKISKTPLYVLGALPLAYSAYLSHKHNREAEKAGKEFADELEGATKTK